MAPQGFINGSAEQGESAVLQRLAELTASLEKDVPNLRGAFPNFDFYEAQEAYGGLELGAAREKKQVLMLGAVKSGKSTLVNALIGKDVMARGSGVKTFCATHVTNGSPVGIRLRFKREVDLAEGLRRDAKLLDFPITIPSQLFPKEGGDHMPIARLQENLRSIELGRSAERGTSANNIAMRAAKARLNAVLAGLVEIGTILEAEGVVLDGDPPCQEFGEDFARFRRWTASPGLAALVADVAIRMPFAQGLDESVSLLDCQGSDSPNPLDFAAVAALLPMADRILYVVGSRIGIRAADVEFLHYLERAHLLERTVVVHNVDGFVPQQSSELQELESRIVDDCSAIREGLAVFSVCALAELGAAESLVEGPMIDRLWQEADAGATLKGLRRGFDELRQFLGAELESRGDRMPALVERVRTTASALLHRDEDLHGVKSLETTNADLEIGLKRIFDGARDTAVTEVRGLVTEVFESKGPLAKDLLSSPENDMAELLRRFPLQSVDGAEQVAAFAAKIVAEAWTVRDATLRTKHIDPLRASVEAGLIGVARKVHHMLEALLADLKGPDSRMIVAPFADWQERLTSEIKRCGTVLTPPPLVRLSSLDSGFADTLPWRFRAATKWDRAWAGMRGREVSAKSRERRLTKLYARAVKRALRRLKGDLPLAMSSARENYKNLYFDKMISGFFQSYGDMVQERIEAHFQRLEGLQSGGRLLLSAAERLKLQNYLDELGRLHPR